ncbi:hypothetical protein KEM54_002179 [Ascosphaera aggregata]|nr:hypothetical protein KEM54_002179 [Ascosphaera aggregata]
MESTVNAVSNNVTVEYTDPSGIFEEVKPLFDSILPLRNLHWKSPTRPLRSIDSLQVDFVPAENAPAGRDRSSSVAHRRHQIPGLRQTPYVKIYLLRCDDNDTYKTVSRKLVRDWIKEKASTTQAYSIGSSGSNLLTQDNHDAFEWLIVHVAPEGVDPSPNSALKWTGRATTSVLEKVRADFNGSSKSAVDRVTQLRIPKGGWSQRKTPEQEAQIEDLVLKLKFGILTAFSLRISQYEEDIREKDSQRSLPGWNFCTFFMLKEGLVLGFEHVGLYDDALMGYDELSVGLDSSLRDQIADQNQHGGTFLEYNPDIFAKLEDALETLSSGESEPKESDEEQPQKAEEKDETPKKPNEMPDCIYIGKEHFPLDVQKKQYREMILANNISVFDFKVYIFSRQMMLLLKAARRNPPRNRTKGLIHADLSLLAELCERASEFISYGSRTLRHDLLKGLDTIQHTCTQEVAEEIVDNLVCSWTYAAVSQVLTETTSPLLDITDLSPTHNGDKMAAAALSAFVAEKRSQLPRRSSSLSTPGGSLPQSPRPPSARQGSPSSVIENNLVNRTGSIDLAATRGDLFLLARRILDKVGHRRSWSQRWNQLSLLYVDDKATKLEEVSLDETADDGKKKEMTPSTPVLNGLETPVLVSAAKSVAVFNQIYEELTDQLFRHYFSAGRIRSSEMALVGLALSKYRASDYASASRLFEHLTAFYGSHRWFTLEGIALELYAECLKKTGRLDAYVQSLLKLLANYAGIAQSGKKAVSTDPKRQSSAAPLSFSDTADTKISQYVAELLEMSKKLQAPPLAQLSHFFSGLKVDPSICHFDNRDGIGLTVSLRFLLGNLIRVDRIKIGLIDPSNAGMSIWFERNEETTIESSSTKVLLEAPASLHGQYVVEKIEVHAGNIIFTREFALTPQADDDPDKEKCLTIALYPPAKGLEAKVTPPHVIDLSKLRTVDVQISCGQNAIENGSFRVKPATAGLRLRIADAAVIAGDITISAVAGTGQIEFHGLKPHAFARINIPYSMEMSQQSLAVRLEITYDTTHGRFQYLSAATILSILPISVNVQDVFQNDVLISKYTVSPGMLTPIRLSSCQLPSSPSYEVHPSLPIGKTLDVFPKQPASILFKTIPHLDDQSNHSNGNEQTLALTIEFTCLDEECLAYIEYKFYSDILSSAHSRFARLLIPRLLQAFTTQWTAGDLEVIGLLREISVLPFEKLEWPEVLRQLGKSEAGDLISWLKQWHKTNKVIHLDSDIPRTYLRRITIPVDVPEVQVVHTALLTFPGDDDAAKPRAGGASQGNEPHRMHAAINEMITAELRIWHTRRWSHPDRREAQALLTFTYEIQTNPDVWIIGGRKRGSFTAEDGECRTFELFLLPQRSGHLLLPALEIKSYAVRSASSEGGMPQLEEIQSEVDYRSHAETVFVSPSFQRTTILLDPTGSSNLSDGNWLIESECSTAVDAPSTSKL